METLYSALINLFKPIQTLIKRFIPQSVQSAEYKFLDKYYFKKPSISPSDYKLSDKYYFKNLQSHHQIITKIKMMMKNCGDQ